jgi:hypothetical protein
MKQPFSVLLIFLSIIQLCVKTTEIYDISSVKSVETLIDHLKSSNEHVMLILERSIFYDFEQAIKTLKKVEFKVYVSLSVISTGVAKDVLEMVDQVDELFVHYDAFSKEDIKQLVTLLSHTKRLKMVKFFDCTISQDTYDMLQHVPFIEVRNNRVPLKHKKD